MKWSLLKRCAPANSQETKDVPPPPLRIDHVQLSLSPNKQSLYLPINIWSEQTSKPVAITTLIDSGAQGQFISHTLAEKHGYIQHPLPKPIPLQNMDGTKNQHGEITTYIKIKTIIDGRDNNITAYVTNTGNQDLIIGFPWLEEYDPDISWKKKTFRWRPQINHKDFIPLLRSLRRPIKLNSIAMSICYPC